MHTISIHVRCIRMNHNIATSQQRRIASGIAVAFNLISFAVRFRFAQRLPCTPNKSLHLCVIEHINMVNRLWCAAVQIAYNEMKNHSTYRIGHRHHLVCHRLCLSWRAGASHMIVQSCSRGFFSQSMLARQLHFSSDPYSYRFPRSLFSFDLFRWM